MIPTYDTGPGWWLDLSKVIVPVGLFAWLGWRGLVAYSITILAMVLKDSYRRGLADTKRKKSA